MKVFYMNFESVSFLTCESPTGAVTQRVNRSCQQFYRITLDFVIMLYLSVKLRLLVEINGVESNEIIQV